MRLRLFRSLISTETSLMSHIELVASAVPNFDGVSINIHQSNDDDVEILYNKVLRKCDRHSLRLMFELNAANSLEVGRLLDKLSNSLATNPNSPDLVVFHAPSHRPDDVETTLAYLRNVLPLAAQFLESHPIIGSSYGRLNSHGNALNNHVIGACHHFPLRQVPQLAELLDVYLPTRLALSSQHDAALAATRNHDFEAVVQNTDALFIDDSEDESTLLIWVDVWRAQQLDGAKETYVVCHTLDDEGDELAKRIRRRFLDCS